MTSIVNETAEQRLFGTQNAIGKRVHDDQRSFEVVGVVRDLKDIEGFSMASIYLPLTSRDFARPPADGITILVHSDSGADALSAIRSEIAFIDPKLNIFNVQRSLTYLDRGRSRDAVFYANLWRNWNIWIGSGGDWTGRSYGLLCGAKTKGDCHPNGAWREQGAGVAAGPARRNGSGKRRNCDLGFLGAMAIARILSALTNVFVDALSSGRAIRACCLARRCCWQRWPCLLVIFRRAGRRKWIR